MLLLNLILALLWAAVTGGFTTIQLVSGFAISYAVLYLVRHAVGQPRYFSRVRHGLSFAAFFLVELFRANLRVALEVLSPGRRLRPGLLAIPLEARTDLEITLLANLLSLTPGTLSIDVSADRRSLYLHAMYAGDPEAVRRHVREDFERRLLQVLR